MIFRRRDRDPARHKIERFEGWWQPGSASPYPNLGGKIEWDAFASGDSEIELFAVVPGLPDGSEVAVMWGDVEVMTVVARGGVVKRDLETKEGDEVPRLAGRTAPRGLRDRLHATRDRLTGRPQPASSFERKYSGRLTWVSLTNMTP